MPCLTRRCFLAIAALACPLLAHAGLPETIVAVKPAVVLVGTFKATDSPRFQLRGTGFIVGDGLRVVTNAHVLPAEPAAPDGPQLVVQVRQANGEWQMRPVQLLGQDLPRDLALLRMAGPPGPALVLGVLNMVLVKSRRESVLSSPSGIAYAIPARHVRELMERHP